MIWNPEKVSAGEISSLEAEVLSAISKVYEYNGESYKALPDYIAQCRSYLAQDDVDLSQEQCSELLSMIEVNIPTAIENGYFQKVESNQSDQSAGEDQDSVSYIDEPEDVDENEQKSDQENESKKNNKDDNQNQQEETDSDSDGKTTLNQETTNPGTSADEKEEGQEKEEIKDENDASFPDSSENESENNDGKEPGEVSSDDKEIEDAEAAPEENEFIQSLNELDRIRREKETKETILIVAVVCLFLIVFCAGRMIYKYYVLYFSHDKASGRWKPKHLSDIHCHILPGVDDGSINMEMTKKLLKMEMENGVDTILFTPHFKRGKSRFNNEKLLQVFEEVKKEALQMNPEMKLYLGEELYYDHSLCDAIEEGKALKLNGTHYVLVEFSPEVEYKTIHKACQSLTMVGVSPILAHIERYPALISKEDHLAEIHKMGVYYQMNITSIMGSNLSRRIYKQKKLLADGWIDFIGSDSHDDENRYPKFKKAWRELLRLCDDEMIERIMWKNPAKLLAGKDIDL
jgi:protein-tyrosine phosphatase